MPGAVSSSGDDFASYGDDGDASNDSYWFTSSDEDDEDGELGAEEIAYRANRMVMFAMYTHYDVIKEVAKFTFEYHLTKREHCQWDIAWYDGPITIRLLQRMQQYQRTNHFPGIYNLAKKNMLGRHLMRLQSVFPEDYDFFPPTYNLPADFKEFLNQVGKKRNRTFIVKPEASCQGKGIFLTRDPESLTTERTIHTSQTGVAEHMVVQRYMHKPYLIDGYKFDLRIYVLVNGISPLRVYVYKDGLARFATVKYASPAPSNLSNLCMHLTNYAINKESSSYVQNDNQDADDVGSKRSYQFVLKKIAQDYGSLTMKRVQDEINEIIVKTMCLAQPHVHHLFRSCQPDDVENSMCFQILGFDIMIDHKMKPSLIEVNQMPSFQTDSPLDYKIKQGVINDCISLLNLSAKRRNRVKLQKKQELQRRLQKGYSHKIPTEPPSTQTSKPVTAVKGANVTTSKIAATAGIDATKQGESVGNNATSETAGTRVVKKGENSSHDVRAQASSPDKAAKVTSNGSPDKQTTAVTTIQANTATNNTQSTSVLFKTVSKANLISNQQKMNIQVSKANMRNLAQQSKQDMIIKKRLLREKNERALCGGYELIYPFVTYEDEEKIKERVTQLQRHGHQGKSVKTMIGLNAPQTLKEKLANLHNQNDQPGQARADGQSNYMNRKASQKSMQTADGEPVKASQLGENTIEMHAIEKIMEEEEEFAINDDEIQQGSLQSYHGNLSERWLKQVKYENFMECARRMWDQFTSGAQVNKQKRLKAKADETQKQQADQEKKDKAKRDIARKNLTQKLRKQAEERRQRQEERIKMMEQIEVEKHKEKMEAHEIGFIDKKKSTEKLDMAELREQHKRLTNKIAESQKKVLEEGLRRNRKSSQFEKREVRKSINNLELLANDQNELRRSQQKIQGFTRPHRLQVNGPNMDYFKAIQQKLQDKQDQRKQIQNQAAQNIKQRVDNHGMVITSAENRRSKTESKQKPATALSELPNEENKFAITTFGQQDMAVNLEYNPEEKSKNSGFPLDHILPVFNLSKKESNFIPIFKPKTVSDKVAYNSFKDKRGGSLAKGSAVYNQQTTSQASIGSKDKTPKAMGSPQPHSGLLVSAASQASLVNGSITNLAALKPQMGQSFREKQQTGLVAGVTENIATHDYNILPTKQMQVNTSVLQPFQKDILSPMLDSFRPIIGPKDFTENNMQLIQKLGGKRAAYHSSQTKAAQQLFDNQQSNDETASPYLRVQQFKSLETVVKTSILNSPPHKSNIRMPSTTKTREQPNVTKISLEVDPSANHSMKHQVLNFNQMMNNAALKNQFIKQPQADLIHKLSRKDLALQGNLAGPSGPKTLQNHKSNKIQTLTGNITVQRLPTHQRQIASNKLNELFADIPSQTVIKQKINQPTLYYRPQETANAKYNKSEGLNTNNSVTNTGVNYMQNVIASSKQPLLMGSAPTSATVNSSLEQPIPLSSNGKPVGGRMEHAYPIRHAMLPELANIHKSKEMKKYTINGRALSNNSQMQAKLAVQSDFLTSYQTANGAGNSGQGNPPATSYIKNIQLSPQKIVGHRRESNNTHKNNVRRHEAYNMGLHTQEDHRERDQIQQLSISGMVMHSVSTPPDQNGINAMQSKQFAKMNQRVGLKSYQAAEINDIGNDNSESPLVNSSFKRNLSVFGGGSNYLHRDTIQGNEKLIQKQQQQHSAQPQKHKNMFHASVQSVPNNTASSIPQTTTGNAQTLQQASARSNIDMITGVSLRHQKEMLEKAGIMGQKSAVQQSKESGANAPLSLFNKN